MAWFGRFAERLKDYWDATLRFLREVRAELKKVIWPDRRQTTMLTSVVVISVAVVALIIWLFDVGLSAVLKAIIGR